MKNNILETILGGRQVTVKNTAGVSSPVMVRALKIAELPNYFSKLEREEELAAFVTGQDLEFIASLEPASVLDIVETAHELNFTTARRWAERRAKHIAELGPIVGQVNGKALPSSAPISA